MDGMLASPNCLTSWPQGNKSRFLSLWIPFQISPCSTLALPQFEQEVCSEQCLKPLDCLSMVYLCFLNYIFPWRDSSYRSPLWLSSFDVEEGNDISEPLKITKLLRGMPWNPNSHSFRWCSITFFSVKPWTPEKIAGMFIVLRPIRCEMKPQKIIY